MIRGIWISEALASQQSIFLAFHNSLGPFVVNPQIYLGRLSLVEQVLASTAFLKMFYDLSLLLVVDDHHEIIYHLLRSLITCRISLRGVSIPT